MKVRDFNSNEFLWGERKYKLIFYQVSHGEMILRSDKDDIAHSHTIDIYFGDVKYMEIPSELNGIRFRRANENDIRYLKSKKISDITEDEVVVIISNGTEYFVVASLISILENDLSYMELPIHCFLHSVKEN